MTLEEFIAMLDSGNPRYKRLCWLFTVFLPKRGEVIYQRKDDNLVEVVRKLSVTHKYPVVDKKLRMVFGIRSSFHEVIRSYLCEYHLGYEVPNNQLPTDTTVTATCYLQRGFGYYISAMRPNVLVLGQAYRPDSFDKDLFHYYEADFTV